MPSDSIRERILQRLQCVLSNIQSGIIIEACNRLPEPYFVVMDNCDDQDSVDGWIKSNAADDPTLNTDIPVKGPGSINVIKTITAGTNAILTKTFATGFDATGKTCVMFFYPDVDKLHSTQGLIIRAGNDASNYWQSIYRTDDMTDDMWTFHAVNIDGGVAGGLPPTVVGTPDKTDIKWLQIAVKTATAPTTLSADDAVFDWWVLFDTSGWLPSGGADAPELDFTDPVVGLNSIAFGKLSNAEPVFGLERRLTTPIDITGGRVSAWIHVYDKTELANDPPFGYSLLVLVGQNLSNWWGKFAFHDDVIDVVNDRTNGWNPIMFDPVTESDFILGSPDITAVDFFAVGGIGVSQAAAIEVGHLKVDLVTIKDLEGAFINDIKKVYRYKINFQQTPASPIMMFSAIGEDQEYNIYPIISSKLLVGVDTEVELPDGALLDKELGKVADDIQVAIGQQQNLWDLARYIKVVSMEFHVKEGTSIGILTTLLEIGFSFNLLDPTKEGI